MATTQLFLNEQKGWHERDIRKYGKNIYDAFHMLSLSEFSVPFHNIRAFSSQ